MTQSKEIEIILKPQELKQHLEYIMSLYFNDGRQIGDDILHQVDLFMMEIFNRSKQNESFNKLVCRWFFNGSTLRLRDAILQKVGFRFENRRHFNAFASMDAARHKFKDLIPVMLTKEFKLPKTQLADFSKACNKCRAKYGIPEVYELQDVKQGDNIKVRLMNLLISEDFWCKVLFVIDNYFVVSVNNDLKYNLTHGVDFPNIFVVHHRHVKNIFVRTTPIETVKILS